MTVARHIRYRTQHPGYFCNQHGRYGIECLALSQLIDRSAGTCEICHESWDLTRPYIDHDHDSPIRAIRGLLCHRCNTALGRAESGRRAITPAMQRYINNAWYRTDALTMYQERARLWLNPSTRDFEHPASARIAPDVYQRIQAQRAAWIETFLADQQALF